MATTKSGTEFATTEETLRSVFFPIVRPNLLQEFKQKWGNILVLTDAVSDQKCPGKLKIEFFSTNAEMFALAPKSYHTICYNTGTVKEGKKGIQKWFELRRNDFQQTLYNSKPIDHCVEVKSLRLDKQKQKCSAQSRLI